MVVDRNCSMRAQAPKQAIHPFIFQATYHLLIFGGSWIQSADTQVLAAFLDFVTDWLVMPKQVTGLLKLLHRNPFNCKKNIK